MIGATALFVLGEFALVAVERTRVEQLAEQGDRRAARVLGALRRLSLELSGAQLGITLTSIVLGFVGEPVFADLIEPVLNALPGVEVDTDSGFTVVTALALATAAHMVFGELAPKTWAIARPLGTAKLVVYPFAWFAVVFGPVIRLLNDAANAIVRLFRIEPREELALLIRVSVEQGAVDAATLPLLARTISFGGKDAGEALVPRTALVALPSTATVAELAEAAQESGHSRILVHGEAGGLDDVVGVVHVKKAYRVPRSAWSTTTIEALVDEVPAVPESRELESILSELTTSGHPLAVVVDEYGGTAGIITVEDVLEEIVGEIEDEYDIVQARPLTWAGVHVVSGMSHADDLREQTGFDLPEGGYETLAGFLLDRLGRIPAPGDRLVHEGWEFDVLSMDGRRVKRVRMIPPPGHDESGDPS